MTLWLKRLWCSWFGSCGRFAAERCYCDRGEEIALMERADTKHDSLRRAKHLTVNPPMSEPEELSYSDIKEDWFGDETDEYERDD